MNLQIFEVTFDKRTFVCYYSCINNVWGMNKMNYKQKIIELIEQIENQEVLMKIYTVVKTHLEILKEKKEKEQKD